MLLHFPRQRTYWLYTQLPPTGQDEQVRAQALARQWEDDENTS